MSTLPDSLHALCKRYRWVRDYSYLTFLLQVLLLIASIAVFTESTAIAGAVILTLVYGTVINLLTMGILFQFGSLRSRQCTARKSYLIHRASEWVLALVLLVAFLVSCFSYPVTLTWYIANHGY